MQDRHTTEQASTHTSVCKCNSEHPYLEWLPVPLSRSSLALDVIGQLEGVLSTHLTGHDHGRGLLNEVVGGLEGVVTLQAHTHMHTQ